MPDVIIGNLPQASALTGAERVPMDQRVGGTIAATALTPGFGYAIVTLGSTNWTACGVPAGVTPAVGLVFTCSAVGTGTGTAQQVETVDAAASEIAALATTNLSYDPATRLLSSSTGADVTLPLVTTQAPGLVPTLAGGTGTFLRADGTWAAPPGGATDLSYDPATRLLSSSTGADVTLPLAGATTAGLLPPTNDGLSLAILTVTGTLTAPHIHGALAGPLYVHVRNDAGVSLPAGSPVHAIGNQGDTDRMLVVLARADDPNTLPANGILLETLAPNADGHAINVGELTGFNTSGLTAGAQVFVGLTGGLTMTITGSAVQAIATVGRVHSSTGSILINASPVLSPVAFSGSYADLTGRPSLATVATSGAYADLSGRPSLATVATSGSYADLSGRPPEISQGDAEAGSATVASLWTAQRWRQAAATWWETVTSAVGRSLVGAADGPAARTAIGAAGSGAITSSGLTMATARLLGRTTASSGAVEEIQVSGGSLEGGVLMLDSAITLPGYGVGVIITPYDAQVAIGSAMTANVIYLTPFAVKKAITVDQLLFRVTTGVTGSSFQYAIYGSNGVLPAGNPIVSSGNLSSSGSTVITHSAFTPFTLLPSQIYWTAINTDINGVGMQTLAAASTNTLNLIGADPATFPLSTTAHVIRLINSATFGTWPNLTGATSSLARAQLGAIPYLRISAIP